MNRYANTLRFLLLPYAGISFAFAFAFAFAWSGYFHLMLPNFTAAKIGWAPSSFQFEIGLSNLGCAILGFMAFFRKNNYLWLGLFWNISGLNAPQFFKKVTLVRALLLKAKPPMIVTLWVGGWATQSSVTNNYVTRRFWLCGAETFNQITTI